MEPRPLTLFLCGDVMSGRGVDQVLPNPGSPELREEVIRDARQYVAAAERLNGQIPRPGTFRWPWGESLRVLEEVAPDVRVINLETTVTRSDEFAPGKPVCYRMSPDNARFVAAGRPDVCVLANNHMLDFGRSGLVETLESLTAVGLRWVGAGRDREEAARPAVVPVRGGGRVVVFAAGAGSSGIPASWAAGRRPGVNFLPELSSNWAQAHVEAIQRAKQPGDIVVASLHWGANWAYRIPAEEVAFAHRLVDGGVDVVHGHSSHHPRAIEVYREKLILYGCGDFIDDYEGITGFEEYRDDLRLLYFPTVEPGSGRLLKLRMVPMQSARLRLRHASAADTEWIQAVLNRTSGRFGTLFGLEQDGSVVLQH